MGGGGGSGGFSDSTGRKEFEEYDAGEWEDSAAGSSSAHRKSTSIPSRTTGAVRSTGM
jgi:epsin